MQMYMVGGCVRDEILGVRSKDIDFSVVLDRHEWNPIGGLELNPFEMMLKELEKRNFNLIPATIDRKHVTVRGFFPKDHPTFPGKPADFVLARKEADYSDGRHPDKVEAGTFEDDIFRRDLTMNALAKDPVTGELIDLVGGVRDIKRKLIRAVGDPLERLSEDPLRALRAIRFAVTKGFRIDPNLADAMREPSVAIGIIDNVADERIADELGKMMRHDSLASVLLLSQVPALTAAIFQGRVSLDASLKTKGRGHS